MVRRDLKYLYYVGVGLRQRRTLVSCSLILCLIPLNECLAEPEDRLVATRPQECSSLSQQCWSYKPVCDYA